MSTATLPEQLSDAARAFAGREHELLIDGQPVAARDGRRLATVDPATGQTITTVAHAGSADVDAAVSAARRAFVEGPWRSDSAADRARLLIALAELVEANAAELAELESLDNGKRLKLARVVDVASTAAHFRHFAGWQERVFGNVVPVSQPDMLCYTRKEPVGVCGQIVPWNFPLLNGRLEAWTGAGRGVHGRSQARRADAAQRPAAR